MAHDADESDWATRRAYLLKYGGAVGGGGLLAGCTSGIDSESESTNATSTETATQSAVATETKTPDGDGDDAYTVSIAPHGDIKFDSVPQRWSNPGGPAYLDMAIALGKADSLVATGFGLYPGVAFEDAGVSPDVDPSSLPVLWQDGGFAKEVFYEAVFVDGDLHAIERRWSE